ncbi:putative molybdenum cofactor sulfurase [Podospora fimiseda]|uniref:Molybdenum cofactor sulfurase n=1 Tax=Podospora fimiseda TaxID=252190 RepID=A0AAN7H307_9PEZI|nr:putative molybdenum cofactor sulfurase [Podospora fimiseda]
MPRPSFLVRFSEKRHRKRASEPNVVVVPSHKQPSSAPVAMSAPPTAVVPPSPQVKHQRHRPLASITSILQAVDRRSLPYPYQQTLPLPQPTTPLLDPYPKPVDVIRREEYPHMNNSTYLDHGGATIYPRTLITRFSTLLQQNLYGNPHSVNGPAKLSGDVVDTVRLRTLKFLGADPKHFDLIFTSNATAAIKLVADSFRDLAEQTASKTFWYGYHRDAHTSLVGVRELTSSSESRCFKDDAEVESWIDQYHGVDEGKLGLFAWPGQSNLTGRRLPLSDWAGRIRNGRRGRGTYTLLDGAGLAMTGDMSHSVFGSPDDTPDFVCLSFYKIFGFPDLGGLVVRKDSGHVLALRKYFGGGTVSMVSTIGQRWHMSKGLEPPQHVQEEGETGNSLHEGLEDGTLPFHSILALGEGIDVFGELYGSMENVSRHTTALVMRLYQGMKSMRYGNGQEVCKIYMDEGYGDPSKQGATVAFNILKENGRYESYAKVEGLANERGIYVRSGGICCPGGLFTALQYEPWQLNRARSAGHHCGPMGLSVINELPTGVVRVSLGAMSTVKDVDTFIGFLHETFVVSDMERGQQQKRNSSSTANEVFEDHVSQVTTCCS